MNPTLHLRRGATPRSTRPLFRFVMSLAAAMAISACNASGTSNMPSASGASQGTPLISRVIPQWMVSDQATTTCPEVTGKPTCLALRVIKNGISPPCSPSSSCGWTAQQLEAAYGISKSLDRGSGTNIAVIVAGDLASAASDLATYRHQYGLGAANLTKYNENGEESNYPPSCKGYGWCVESDLDIDMVSAACPECNVFLIETKGAISDFETGEAEAVKLGATILSNSWTCYGSNDCGDSNFGNYFDSKGVAYLASSGDEGPSEIGAPSVLASVIAVGGTQLAVSGSTYSETFWKDAGFGCATGVSKPSWQKDPNCSSRTEVDVSLEAGCAPGVAIYVGIYGGWESDCGTSVGPPFTAGVIGLAGNSANVDGGKTFWTFDSKQHKKIFHHPTGSDGSCGTYLCGDGRYKKYYSAPGGWGTPNGIRAY